MFGLKRKTEEDFGDMAEIDSALPDTREASASNAMAHDFRAMVDAMPINVMTCNLADFRIDYVNKASLDTLRSIEHALPVKADAMLGSSIDIFHKVPNHQHTLLRDPANLPHHALITIGGEWLDLTITALRNAQGDYIAPLVTWFLATDRVAAEAEVLRQGQMLDQMPINAMLCDASTFDIVYANATSLETLRTLESLLPIKASELIGSSIDVFHKNPAHQRKLLSDPANLPWQTKIRVGPETLDLRVCAVNDAKGVYRFALLTWAIVTQHVKLADDFDANVKGVVDVVASAASEMQSTSQSMAAAAEETNVQAQSVATAAEELTSSAQEIGRQVLDSSRIVNQAVEQAKRSGEQVQGLANAADKIGDVVALIQDISAQTKLLALNATIEAARAGESGRGFAVVANEVKELASQTAAATSQIDEQIGSMQSVTRETVTTIGEIASVIDRVNEISAAISAAVEQQNAALMEVTRNIAGVSEASSESGSAASQTLAAAGELAQQGEQLRAEVLKFLDAVRSM